MKIEEDFLGGDPPRLSRSRGGIARNRLKFNPVLYGRIGWGDFGADRADVQRASPEPAASQPAALAVAGTTSILLWSVAPALIFNDPKVFVAEENKICRNRFSALFFFLLSLP